LKKQHKAKHLRVENTYLSSAMFLSSLKNYMHMECLLGLRSGAAFEERKLIINYAVKLFLKSHS